MLVSGGGGSSLSPRNEGLENLGLMNDENSSLALRERVSEGQERGQSESLGKITLTRKGRFAPQDDVFKWYFTPHFSLRKAGFTLAEVLITLGIIGVVAALTLPTVVQNYRNQTVGTKLSKFYSQVNQAIQLSEAEYGAKETWYVDSDPDGSLGDYGDEAGSISLPEKWFMKYFGSHMTVVKRQYDDKDRPTFYFKDGTALKLMTEVKNNDNPNYGYLGARDWLFYTIDPDKCEKLYGSEKGAVGKCAFMFLYIPTHHTTYGVKYHLGRGFEPYKYLWDGTKSRLYNSDAYGCKKRPTNSTSSNAYCTAIIQLNGWKIPKEYPFKVQ